MPDIQTPGKDTFPNLDGQFLDLPDLGKLTPERPSTHPPRILLLYGSLRERSYSASWPRRPPASCGAWAATEAQVLAAAAMSGERT